MIYDFEYNLNGYGNLNILCEIKIIFFSLIFFWDAIPLYMTYVFHTLNTRFIS